MVSDPGVHSNEDLHAPPGRLDGRDLPGGVLNPESRKKPARSTTAKPATAKKSPKQQKNNIIVRLARVEDVEACRAIGRALHEKTIFAHIPWSDKKFDRQCDELLKLPPNKAGLVAELNGRVLGFVYLSCGEYFLVKAM